MFTRHRHGGTRSVSGSGTRSAAVADAGACPSNLKRLVALETLILSDTFITKVWGLRKLTTLKRLDLVGTEVPEDKVARLREAMPECAIEY